ncbi:MAG: division/cell wall cluster transcriptional repressor MraZ [Candidatus Latescibacteria bacterium]|nr:division/cell wall cluster transcriptional repressor MraZ [Candidatus Latescibacterota bacterium]
MLQFLGEYDVPVDEKGRIFLPAEFRRKLPAETEDTLVVVKGLDGCLTAYPQHAWGEIANKMMRLPQTDAKVRVFIRGMLSQAAEVKLDRQGRANLPRKLLDRVGITDRVVVIGALDKIELWNPEAWAQFMQQADSALEEVAETLEL